MEPRVDKGMTSVSLTLRLNVNKYATLTYYKPRIKNVVDSGAGANPLGLPLQQKTFMEDYSNSGAGTNNLPMSQGV